MAPGRSDALSLSFLDPLLLHGLVGIAVAASAVAVGNVAGAVAGASAGALSGSLAAALLWRRRARELALSAITALLVSLSFLATLASPAMDAARMYALLYYTSMLAIGLKGSLCRLNQRLTQLLRLARAG